jgi:hypothetical protein
MWLTHMAGHIEDIFPKGSNNSRGEWLHLTQLLPKDPICLKLLEVTLAPLHEGHGPALCQFSQLQFNWNEQLLKLSGFKIYT